MKYLKWVLVVFLAPFAFPEDAGNPRQASPDTEDWNGLDDRISTSRFSGEPLGHPDIHKSRRLRDYPD